LIGDEARKNLGAEVFRIGLAQRAVHFARGGHDPRQDQPLKPLDERLPSGGVARDKLANEAEIVLKDVIWNLGGLGRISKRDNAGGIARGRSVGQWR